MIGWRDFPLSRAPFRVTFSSEFALAVDPENQPAKRSGALEAQVRVVRMGGRLGMDAQRGD